MLRLTSILLSAAFLLAACGGSPPAGTDSPATQDPGGQPTPAAPPPDGSQEVLTTDDLAGAVRALEALGSWKFELTYYIEGPDEGLEKKIDGAERRAPEIAVDATHYEESGDFRYVRIADDVWTDVGTGNFFHAVASESPNLIAQYEPLHLGGLIKTTTGWRRAVEYELVGREQVNGTPALHYTLNPFDREDLVERTDLEPDQWAGDIWLAEEGGYLLRFAWGPQSAETADAGPIGFVYDVTEVRCECPIEEPN